MGESRDPYDVFGDARLNAAGLNLQAVIAVADLPEALQAMFAAVVNEGSVIRTLVLFGNGGPAFWHAYSADAPAGPHPVDAYSRAQVTGFMARRFAGVAFRFLYPGGQSVPLQTLGQWAGWHHDSPMKVGINDSWGLWYAYRALIGLEQAWPSSPRVPSCSPCAGCVARPCIDACPAGALADAGLRLNTCIDFRLRPASVCADQCLARWACPVASEQRYDLVQVQCHYGHSLPHLRQWRKTEGSAQ